MASEKYVDHLSDALSLPSTEHAGRAFSFTLFLSRCLSPCTTKLPLLRAYPARAACFNCHPYYVSHYVVYFHSSMLPNSSHLLTPCPIAESCLGVPTAGIPFYKCDCILDAVRLCSDSDPSALFSFLYYLYYIIL